MEYAFKEIEPKWQKHWQEQNTFRTDLDHKQKPKYYILDMFPYPSASGLHVGHVEGYTATDILARYKRARGYNVLHPMGWDAFGLPAEQYALQTGVHPAITTYKAIENFKGQLQRLGLSYDWQHEITTCEPKYYKWTQFIFQKLHEKGLAYQKEVPVNWCPALKTVLANEEVVDGKSERGGHPVFRVPMKQWMLKITDYAERLLKDLDQLDWPETTKEMQRNWIGKSEGLELNFSAGHDKEITVFTTRPDTLFGVTFLVLAPEHPLVKALTTDTQRTQVDEYIKQAQNKSELSRQEQTKEKTGVFTGGFAQHPLTKEPIPVWIADYVMMNYGTGAVMAVPGHDQRDYEFAQTFQLPIKIVVQSEDNASQSDVAACYSGDGININSDFLNGLQTKQAIETMIERIELMRIGKRKVQYKLRDWLFSRQRYWGEPIPVIHTKTGESCLVNSSDLPVILPDVQSYEPTGTGESPLAAITQWVDTEYQGKPARRETDTMPGSAGSSWYFLRFIDANNDREPFSPAREKHWLPVDLYLGGPEHAVGHLLYSRFWMKVLFDIGLVSHSEPFQKLVHQGMILGEDGEKMSKSRGNVVNPDSVIDTYGTDSLRLYEMFMGPLEKEKPWSTSAIDGVHRFLNRTWRLFFKEGGQDNHPQFTSEPASAETTKLLHKTIRQVTESIDTLRFNTAISSMMIFVNHMTKVGERPKDVLLTLIQLLAPFAPHMAEELWEKSWQMDAKTLAPALSFAPWPTFDANLAKDDLVTIAIQILGKTKGTVQAEPGSDQTTVEALARQEAARHLEGKTVKKVIYVKDKIINFVVN